MIMEQSLVMTQEQLSQRVAEAVRLEHTMRKQQMELKTLRERNTTNEDELTDQSGTIGEIPHYICVA